MEGAVLSTPKAGGDEPSRFTPVIVSKGGCTAATGVATRDDCPVPEEGTGLFYLPMETIGLEEVPLCLT